MRSDFERAKHRTIHEFNKLVEMYNEAVDENGGIEGGTEIFGLRQQIYAVQSILKNAFGEYHDFERRKQNEHNY